MIDISTLKGTIVLNKFGDEIGSIFDYSAKDLSLMLQFKQCSLKEV